MESKHFEEAFSNSIPYFDYDKITRECCHRYHNDEENITWPGLPEFFALSSGTTGKVSKRIPIADDMLDIIKQAGIRQVTALSNFDFDSDLFEKEIMMLGSFAN